MIAVMKLILLLLSLSHNISPVHERKEDDKVTLICTVLTYEKCGHTVEWLYQGKKDHFPDLKSSQSSCSATVTLTTSSLTLKTKCDESFKCNVTDRNSGHQLLCDFNPQSPCEKAGLFI